MLSWIKEFKDFALRGNMVDLAIGVIIGAAFNKVVNSLVTDVITPPIGFLIGGVNFSSLVLNLYWPGSSLKPVAIRYGSFLNTLLDLLLTASAIFLAIKAMNKLYKKAPDTPTTKDCPECAMSIPIKAKKCGHCGSNLVNNP